MDDRESLAVFGAGRLDFGDVNFHNDQTGGLDLVNDGSGEMSGQVVVQREIVREEVVVV